MQPSVVRLVTTNVRNQCPASYTWPATWFPANAGLRRIVDHPMESIVRDIRYVTRALLRTPAFFTVTIITLALGVGATTAIYSVINGVLLRPLPYPDPDRIVQMWQVGQRGGRGQVSDPNYDD